MRVMMQVMVLYVPHLGLSKMQFAVENVIAS